MGLVGFSFVGWFWLFLCILFVYLRAPYAFFNNTFLIKKKTYVSLLVSPKSGQSMQQKEGSSLVVNIWCLILRNVAVNFSFFLSKLRKVSCLSVI